MFNGAFNISSNYLLNSDYSISYIPDVKLKPAGEKSAPVNYAAGKTKMALWFVSHCEASSGRDAYVKELQKYNITVDILGELQFKAPRLVHRIFLFNGRTLSSRDFLAFVCYYFMALVSVQLQ